MAAASMASDAAWYRVLARCALAMGLTGLGLVGLFLGGVGFDPSVPPDYAELVQASRRLAPYRAAMLCDGLDWILIGGVLVAISGLARPHASARSLFLLACGIGQVVGAIGGFLRLDATSAFAARYAVAGPAEQAALQETYRLLDRVIGAHFHAGQLLQGLGFLLAASVALRLATFPRWLAWWLALPGATSLLLFVLDVFEAFWFPVLLFHVIVGLIALAFTLAWTFWRQGQGAPAADQPPVPAAAGGP